MVIWKLSRYILRYDTEDGSVYFNIKNNHSFLITNELKKNIQENKTTEIEENEVNKYLKQIEDRNNEIVIFVKFI